MVKRREHNRRVRTRYGKRQIIINKGIKKRPRSKDSLWHNKYIHGPRLIQPEEFKRIWISKEKWPREKWFTSEQQKKVRNYARQNQLKLTKGFPKTTKVKIGLSKKTGKLKPQSFITPSTKRIS